METARSIAGMEIIANPIISPDSGIIRCLSGNGPGKLDPGHRKMPIYQVGDIDQKNKKGDGIEYSISLVV